MNLLIKILLLFVFLTILFVLAYEMVGQNLENLFSQEKTIEWFLTIKPFAWIIGILLLISDILLPIPATGIMAALGSVYGVFPGTFFSTAGSVGAGLIGYGITRLLGRKASRWIASEKEILRFKAFFDQWGGYAVILSRSVPILPEVTSILAGLSRMKFSRFLFALMAGTIPVSFLFSWMGAYSGFPPGMGIFIAAVLPALIWPFFIKIVKI